jgi:hypothetical protein
MPEFKKKAAKFQHKGMQWNRPIDAIPEEQIVFGKNVRVTQQGTISERPGTTLFATLTGTYIHSIARWNNFNTTLLNPTFAYVVGIDTGICVGDTAAHLQNAALNPIKLPPAGSTNTLSGNPLTMVDMAPSGTGLGWKYIGDNNLNFSVGYYPGDTTAGMARAVTMGMTPPITPQTVPAVGAAGLLTGSYQWAFAYRNRYTGARSNPSAATRVTLAAPSLVLAAQAATLVAPTTPIDPQTGAADANILIDIYRYGGTIFDWRYVGTTTSGVTHTDNVADADILTAATPPEITDPITGVTRFNLYRPFVTQDNAVYSSTNGTITIEATGKYILTAGGTDVFNINWLPGQVISINNNAWTIQQVRSTTVIEITDNPGANLVSGSTYPWATFTGTLKAGVALPHIWGPYGTGSGGAYIFGCGGTVADSGTLYWTNGNDPDSTDLANSLIVTSPSEPLRGGCVYDGTPFVWSTERMFRIYPGTIAGQFTVQEIPGGKGLWAEYSLTVQSNSISDQSVTWVGKDGIYDFSNSGGLRSLTDRDLYPFFPHDNMPGVALGTLFPAFGISIGGPYYAPDYSVDANMKYHRLTWFQGELFYDYVGLVPAILTKVFYTLVYDSRNAEGWVSVDQIDTAGFHGANSNVRGVEIAANNLLIGSGFKLFNYTGTTDNTVDIACVVVTRQDDCGDPRGEKLFGDVLMDLNAGVNTGVTVYPTFNYGLTGTGVSVTYTNASRSQSVQDLTATGLGWLSKTCGLSIFWSAGSVAASLYGYTYSYVPKSEKTSLRATDKTDDGYAGAKYLRGLCIEANCYGLNRTVDVVVDDVVVATVNMLTATQLELPFAITPVVGSEFQLQPTDANSWAVFSVRWTWEKWPDLTIIQSPWMDLGTTKPKYMRGFTIPISGPAAPVLAFTATYEDGSAGLTGVAPVSISQKSTAQYSFNPPILAHQIKLTPSTPCRVWYDEIKWDAEEWPELASLYGPVERLGDSGAKYLRGFELPIETNAAAVVMVLNYDSQPTAVTGVTASEIFPAVTTAALSKNVFPFNPVSPIIAHEFQLKSNLPARFWYGEVKWDYEPWPEFDTGKTAWMDAGTPGAKFMQGLVVSLDTGGLPVTFDLVYDGGSVAIGPLTTPAGRKTPVPWSYLTPFIAHEFQLSPRTPCRIWYEEIKWVWEPVPELVTTYTTQATDHDLPGYHYLFDAYIAYIGSSDAPIFQVVTEYGTDTYTLPVSNGVYTRAYVLLHPRKAKWRSYSFFSSGGIRLFLKDCEVRAKNWTDKGQYPSSFQSLHPFGDESRIKGAAI